MTAWRSLKAEMDTGSAGCNLPRRTRPATIAGESLSENKVPFELKNLTQLCQTGVTLYPPTHHLIRVPDVFARRRGWDAARSDILVTSATTSNQTPHPHRPGRAKPLTRSLDRTLSEGNGKWKDLSQNNQTRS
jgi:hypothetical protein